MSEHNEKHARKTFLPPVSNAPPPPKDTGPNRCEKCIYWFMKDPRQKNKSCFDRAFEAHDVCDSFYLLPERLRQDLIKHVQELSAFEVYVLFDVLTDRLKQISQANKVAIRQFIRKTGGAVVCWRDDDGKKKAAKVERVTASNVMLKKSDVEKIRVTEVLEIMSREEYKARKSGKVREREEVGRKVKK